MPWKVNNSVPDARRAFLEALETNPSLGVAELSKSHRISRSLGYRLAKREADWGREEAVKGRSRRPNSSPTAIGALVEERILSLRCHFPDWGPKTLAAVFAETSEDPPSASTIRNVLTKYEMLGRQRRQRTKRVTSSPLPRGRFPNDVWAVDHKGAMKALDRLEPLTVIDEYSRYWLCCRPLTDKGFVDTKEALAELFAVHGRPTTIRVDGGQPWASTAFHRLTKLSTWLISEDVKIQVEDSPQKNGVVERLHGTMEREIHEPPDGDIVRHFEISRRSYNEHRPHQRLAMAVPSSRYTPPPAEKRGKNEPFDYSGTHDAFVRTVTNKGSIHLNGNEIFISEALNSHRIGVRAISRDRWKIFFHGHPLGLIDGGTFGPIPAPKAAQVAKNQRVQNPRCP